MVLTIRGQEAVKAEEEVIKDRGLLMRRSCAISPVWWLSGDPFPYPHTSISTAQPTLLPALKTAVYRVWL